jgi:sugar/nucleoside kinase (ribokinase family)
MKYDFVAIGDITTDAFIKLSDAHVIEGLDHASRELCVRFGEKVPFDSVTVVRAVGNAGNAAVSAHRLGVKSALHTYVGDDSNGADCLATLKEEGLSTEYIGIQVGTPTNYHYVLQYGAERTILVKQEKYKYVLPAFAEPPKWLYLTSLGEHALPFHDEVAAYIEQHPETKLAFQPGTFQIKIGATKLKRTYQASTLFFCNKEEAQQILDTTQNDMRELLVSMRMLGPKIPVITDGPNGAYAFDGEKVWFVPMYPDPMPPVSRTGAGDAFSSTVTTYMALGFPLGEALLRGPINSMNVVQHVGAQKGLLSKDKIEELLRSAPPDYKLKQIT